jgi:hypothetical protein
MHKQRIPFNLDSKQSFMLLFVLDFLLLTQYKKFIACNINYSLSQVSKQNYQIKSLLNANHMHTTPGKQKSQEGKGTELKEVAGASFLNEPILNVPVALIAYQSFQ